MESVTEVRALPGEQHAPRETSGVAATVGVAPDPSLKEPLRVSRVATDRPDGADRPSAVIVLAAGEGTRMRSTTPKVLHDLGGRSLLGHALAAASSVTPEHLVVVVRHDRDAVAAHAVSQVPAVLVADQDDVPGTGRAVQCGLDALPSGALDDGSVVLVTCGDVPLLSAQTLHRLVETHTAAGAALTVLTATLPDPTGYGRVVRGEDGAVMAIVEQKDASETQRAIHETNSGVYAFDAGVLARALPRLGRANASGEVYLTDVVGLAREEGRVVTAMTIEDVWQTEGVNDRAQLSRLHAEANRRTVRAHQLAGVTVVDPATTWVDATVVLDQDVTLLPNVQLHGETTLCAGARVGPDTTLTDMIVGPGATVVRSHASGSRIGAGATVGPFSYLRPGTDLGVKGKIGGFVETKNSSIGAGSKVPHLSYVGDAQIGESTNIGAASVFVNYDGLTKHRTVVGDHVRVGSDTMLIAPVEIGDGAYTAAGSVITSDVPAGALAVARGVQRTVAGWVARRRPGSAADRAAAAAQARETDATAAGRHDTETSPSTHQTETGATP